MQQIPSGEITPLEIIEFWQKAGPARWFSRSDEFDKEIRERFGHLLELADRGKLDGWQETAEGMLALILILDQFRRNLFRDSAKAFAQDELAQKLAQMAIDRGYDDVFDFPLKRFIYMPFMHAENIEMQDRLIELCQKSDDDFGVKWGIVHADIIRKFGRFPHRNKVLGRQSSKQEDDFLDRGGFAG